MCLVLVGANQAELAGALALDLSRSGLLVAAIALGAGSGMVAAGPLFDRGPRRPLFVASLLLTGASLLGVRPGMGFASWLGHLLAAGVGLGAYATLLNAAIAERFRERSAKPLTLLHAGATLGAIAGPLAIGWLSARGQWLESFRGTGLAHLALAAWALAARFPAPEPRGATDEGATAHSLLPFAVVAFAYVGVETALTGFAVPYATSGLDLGPERGRGAISAFWLGLLAGRLALLGLRGGFERRALQTAGLLGAAILAAGVLLRSGALEIVFAAAGVALGGVYPLLIALVGQRFPQARGRAAGLAAGAGALGGFAIPPATGALGDVAGIAPAMASLAVWSLAIALAATFTRR